MMLIELTDGEIEWLLACKKTNKRVFGNWTIQQLLQDAIYEFKEKYADKGEMKK